MRLTHHAAARAQQRAIPGLIIEWLNQYGAVHHDHRGASLRYLDKRAKAKLRSELGPRVFKRYERKLRAYLVVSGDTVLTVGYRTRPLRGGPVRRRRARKRTPADAVPHQACRGSDNAN